MIIVIQKPNSRLQNQKTWFFFFNIFEPHIVLVLEKLLIIIY